MDKDKIPYGYCHCGCGEKTKISSENNIRLGYKKGNYRLYLPGHNMKNRPLKKLIYANDILSTKDKERTRQRTKIYYKNKITPAKCEWCGEENNQLQRHHPDYTNPEEIIWVCKSCHTIVHFKLKSNCK